MAELTRKSTIPLLKRMKFGNTTVENLELGDILYFTYNIQKRQDAILNPCIVYGGYDSNTNLIMGVSLRNFYKDKLLTTCNSFLSQYEGIYWPAQKNEDGEETKSKKFVNYNSGSAFRYENLRKYSSCNVIKTTEKGREPVNLLEEYWRGYVPSKMYVVLDDFAKLTMGNISINIDTARVIINIAPKSVTVQQGI